MKRIAYYDNLKLLLIFMVIFGHFCEISADSTTYGTFLLLVIYSFHMPLFIFASGLFNRNDSADKVRQRAVGFMVIYLLMKVIALFMRAALYGNWGFSLLTEGGMPWFMLALSVWTILAYITRDLDKRVILLVSIITALAVGYDYSLTTQFSISKIIVFWPFFWWEKWRIRRQFLKGHQCL